jgi:hypothetical protein
MIDPEVARFALSQMMPGEQANFVTGPEKRTFSFEVVTLKDFSVVVKTAIGGLLELPISKAETYIKEHEKMNDTSRMTLPAQSATTAPPGRARRRTKAEIEAANEAARVAKQNGHAVQQQPAFQPQPSFDSWKPPNSTVAAPNSVLSADSGQSWQTGTNPHATLEGVRVEAEKNTQPEAEDNWIEKAVREAGESFLAEITGIITTIYQEKPIEEPAAPRVKTCFDCIMINVNENKCDKYLITPPLSVIKTAQTVCEGFYPNDEIPY